MKSPMINAAVAIVLSLGMAQGYAASFAKYDGIDGESRAHHDDKHKDWINLESVSMSKKGRDIQARPQKPQPVSLLVPAVQKVRAAATKSGKKGNIEYNWKVEEGES